MDKFHNSNIFQNLHDVTKRTSCSRELFKPAPVSENANYIKILNFITQNVKVYGDKAHLAPFSACQKHAFK